MFGDQSACPFRAFALQRLGARGLERGRPGLDARERGKLLHRAVAQLWGDLESQARLLAMSDDDLGAVIGLAVGAAVQWLQRSRPDVLSEAFAAIERKRLGVLLTRLLELEKRRAAFRVVHREEPRELDVAGLKVAARIDRIDVLDDGSRVIMDYKTGSASPNEWIGERPDDPQLPLYSVTDPGPVAAVSFAVLCAEEVAFKGLAREAALLPNVVTLDRTKSTQHIPSWESLFDTWRSELDRLAGAFLAGHAAVAPKDYPRTCDYCELGALCRVREALDRGPGPARNDADD